MGVYHTPYQRFGRLTYEMWRACRLVVDTGMHAMDWTREQAQAFLAANTGLSMHEIRTEVDRYIAWPGQALAYKVGELKIVELRKRAEAALGADFDLRAFHDAVLENGGVTLSVLERRIDAYIERDAGKAEPVSARSPALAKLTRPKLYDALPRPRLFALLDEAVTRPIVWVCAPPGAGKTTLVASYLEARGLRHLWYQIDIADSDPATFVHYMRMAALQLVGKKAAALPHFNPEPQQDIARFARTYFREFFAVLPRPTVIALDSFHEARTGNELRAAFAHALEEVPDGITVIAISRGDPPPEFARLVASRRIARIEPAALACTPDEAEAILGSDPLDGQTLQRITRQSDGWVAALVLLREHLSRDGAHARRVDRRREGRDLPVLRRRDLQSRASPRTSAC